MDKINLGKLSLGNQFSEMNAQSQSEAETSFVPKSSKESFCKPSPCSRNEIAFTSCEDAKTVELSRPIENQGRILDLTVTLRNICPGKRVALSVQLYELDCFQREYHRGLKIMTVPAHHNMGCTNVRVAPIRFIMPEDISVSMPQDGCRSGRRFKVRVDAHYIDINLGAGAVLLNADNAGFGE